MDGLLFTMTDSLVVPGTTNTLLKWKPMPTVDVVAAYDESTGEYAVCANSDTGKELIRINSVNEFSLKLSWNNVVSTAESGSVVECMIKKCDGNVIMLIPMRQRHDKSSPNAESVVKNTVREAMDVIEMDELVKACVS